VSNTKFHGYTSRGRGADSADRRTFSKLAFFVTMQASLKHLDFERVGYHFANHLQRR